mgnify:CR=1 FL=1
MYPVLTINADLVLIITATLIPLFVGLITKLVAPPALKAILLIVIGTIATAIAVSTGADGIAVISKTTLIESFQTVVTSIAMYYGVFKPTNISPAINKATANFGLNFDIPVLSKLGKAA